MEGNLEKTMYLGEKMATTLEGNLETTMEKAMATEKKDTKDAIIQLAGAKEAMMGLCWVTKNLKEEKRKKGSRSR